MPATSAVPPATRLDPKTDQYGSYISQDAGIVIGCCSRSGSSLFRVMLDSHPKFAVGQGSRIFVETPDPQRLVNNFGVTREYVDELLATSQDQAHFIERFMRGLAQREDKPIWGDKAPPNIYYIPYIFEHFPNARFIHIIRDGRDVVCSLRTHPKFKYENGRTIELDTWKPIENCITSWVNYTRKGLAARGQAGYYEVHYEDLVQQPEQTMRKVVEFLGEEWDDRVLRYHELESTTRDFTAMPVSADAVEPISHKALARWQRDMTDEDKQIFKDKAGDLLIELGYATDNDW
ncbi:Sulfotransferase domain protein [Symmachiella macrocystis]|uniref:Sulfotransferase domain protein n=1 Tax=Symmachiella macrocystis TaxID=2527985 RepID=A0A5C6BQ84_9PLAN|nr:sulfotransferase [Symmachiella macrocystis]TWU12784.1 Sulfotransferase domain protein [Symmachiella macrocystis]